MRRCLLLFALLLPACVQDDPVSPFEPQMSNGGGAGVYHFPMQFDYDNTVPIDCLGESLRFTGTQYANAYVVFTPSGLSRQHMYAIDGENTAFKSVVGVPSGTVWTVVRGAPELRNVMKLGGRQNAIDNMEGMFLENASGQRLHLLLHALIAVDAQGNVLPVDPLRIYVNKCTLLGGK